LVDSYAVFMYDVSLEHLIDSIVWILLVFVIAIVVEPF